jgi:hypothetical protein
VPATTRLLLLLAAADDRATLRDVLGAALVAAADGGTIGLDALTPAVAAALITIDRQAIRFRHPLMRSAVYHAADAAARLDAHAALAQVLHEDPDRPAWHHAAAATGPDDGVAAELDWVADRARRRGALDTAIVARERAAMLTVTAAARVRRLLDAAGLAVELGQRDAAHRLLAQVDHRIADPVAAARALWLREMLAHDAATDARQHVLVQAAGVARTAGADGLATDLLWLGAVRCWWYAGSDDGCADVAAALARLAPIASSPRLLLARAYAAPPSRAAGLIDEVTASAVDASGPEAMWLLGNAVHILGGFDLASTLLRSAAAGLRTEGRLGPLARVLSLQAGADAHPGTTHRRSVRSATSQRRPSTAAGPGRHVRSSRQRRCCTRPAPRRGSVPA